MWRSHGGWGHRHDGEHLRQGGRSPPGRPRTYRRRAGSRRGRIGCRCLRHRHHTGPGTRTAEHPLSRTCLPLRCAPWRTDRATRSRPTPRTVGTASSRPSPRTVGPTRCTSHGCGTTRSAAHKSTAFRTTFRGLRRTAGRTAGPTTRCCARSARCTTDGCDTSGSARRPSCGTSRSARCTTDGCDASGSARCTTDGCDTSGSARRPSCGAARPAGRSARAALASALTAQPTG
jgi:hypothetical protein